MEHTTGTDSTDVEVSSNREAHSSGVSWAAVLAGAFVAAALSLTLLALGAGFGLLSVSPWSNTGASAPTVSTAAIVWLIVIQIVASGVGGYLAGRLRTKWAAIHSDEVYFRDTAHGFLVWAVAVVITAAFLGSAATAMVGGAATSSAMSSPENGYFVDALFRSATGQTAANTEDTAVRRESAGILANMLRNGDTAAADQAYLAQLVSSRNRAEPERCSATGFQAGPAGATGGRRGAQSDGALAAVDISGPADWRVQRERRRNNWGQTAGSHQGSVAVTVT